MLKNNLILSATAVNNTELLELLREKNREGFSLFYDKFASVLFSVICRFIKNTDVAEEILQDVFVKVWKNIHHYDERKGSLFTWLMQITRNMAIDYLRSKTHKNEMKDKDISGYENLPASVNTYYNTESRDIRNIANRLEPKYREIIDLVYFCGYSQDEVSKLLNMPLGTVKTRSRTGLKLMRSYFEEPDKN